MTINIINCITQAASYLRVPAGKITLDVNSIPVRTENNTCSKGFAAIIFELLLVAKCNTANDDLMTIAELRQWLQYIIVYIMRINSEQDAHQILKELNGVLNTRTYLVNDNLSIVDVLMYYVLHSIMFKLSYLEKEKYLNVCRWFDNLQQSDAIRQKNKIVAFNTNYLACVAPTRHVL